MYQHIVCFKFKENTPSESVQQHLEMFAALKDSIPQIVTYAGGRTVKGDEGADQYDTAHYLTYETREDIEKYNRHEAHQAFIEANKTHWANVLVLDSEIMHKKGQ